MNVHEAATVASAAFLAMSVGILFSGLGSNRVIDLLAGAAVILNASYFIWVVAS